MSVTLDTWDGSNSLKYLLSESPNITLESMNFGLPDITSNAENSAWAVSSELLTDS